jgi:hypothetical protein
MGTVTRLRYESVESRTVTKTYEGPDREGNWISIDKTETVPGGVETVRDYARYCDRCGGFHLKFYLPLVIPQELAKNQRVRRWPFMFAELIIVLLGLVFMLSRFRVLANAREARTFPYVFIGLCFPLLLAVFIFGGERLIRKSIDKQRLAKLQASIKQQHANQPHLYCECLTCGASYQEASDLSDLNPRGYTEKDVPYWD